MICSFENSFSTSATGCSSPNGPTRFGPTRSCMRAIALRSAHTCVITTSATNVTVTPMPMSSTRI